MKNKILLAALSLLAVVACATGAAAQETVAPAAQKCAASDIAGEWLMMTNNDYAPSICLLKINSSGEVKKGECSTGREEAKLVGDIIVDKQCAVFGKFKIKTKDETLPREISFGFMAPDKSYFTMVAAEKNGKELNTSFVQRVPK